MSSSPPSSSSPFMNGNFDYPPASASPPPTTGSNTVDILHRVRRNLDREREQERVVRETARAAYDEEIWANTPPSGALSPRRRPPRAETREAYRRRAAVLRRPLPSTLDSTNDSSLRRAAPPTIPSTNNRPRATPGDRYLRRARQIREQRARALDMDDSDTRAFNPFPPRDFSFDRRSPPSDNEESRRQSKRRKLEHDEETSPSYDGFMYGHEGQVVPGRLRMEILSCDGGEYEPAIGEGEPLYPPSNVLKNDRSVYCSKSSRCNLLLKHIGGTPFCLERIVIRAPDRGFTAPVQEGMIFIAMSPDDLLSGTAGYQIEYESQSQDASETASSHGEERIPFAEAINDPYVWENSRQGHRETTAERRLRERSNLRNIFSGLGSRDSEPPSGTQNLADNCDWLVNESNDTTAGVSAPTLPPRAFTVTAESDDDSDNEQEQTSPAAMEDRRRREVRWRTDSDDDDDELVDLLRPSRQAYSNPIAEARLRSERSYERRPYLRRASRLDEPSYIAPGKFDGAGLIVPHARFFIACHKNKITINFDPAVSGKYILLKLWSPIPDGNIDIESVQFHGYSGPRFFPAIQIR